VRAVLEVIPRRWTDSERLETNKAATLRACLEKFRAFRFVMKAQDEKRLTSFYSARHMAKPINFFCEAPNAKSVQLEGDFSAWARLKMQRRVDGWWFLQVPLTHGHHQYRFVVDGQPLLDPRATGVARNNANEDFSVVAVG
jgi:1,4-alpha-glucan branching enzyme